MNSKRSSSMESEITLEQLLLENEELRSRLDETEGAINALRAGEVDAVLVESAGQRVLTLDEVDKPYRLLVEQVPTAAAALTCEGQFLSCNRRFAALLGAETSAIIGRDLLWFLDPSERETLPQLLLEAQSGDLEAEVSLRDAAGNPVSVFAGFSSLEVGAFGSCVVLTDHTDRHRYEQLRKTQEALRASEERLALAQRAGRIGSFDWKRDTDEVSWSATMEELYGLRPGTFSGSFDDWCAAIHPEDRSRVREELRSAMRGGDELDTQFRVLGRGDSSRWLASRGRLLYDDKGKPQRLIGVSMDITESERTGVELRDADRRKDEFLATLAHELRNPLAPIRNAVQILRAHASAEPEVIWSRDVIDRQVRIMARLLEDLLDVSRISRGRLELRTDRVTLREVIESALETSRPAITDSECALTVSLPADPVWIEADAMRLSQVFSNLLNNAAKYNHLGGQIAIVARREENQVVVSIKDSGIGIEAEMLPHVFDMFAQVTSSQTVSQGGLGIGLSLVRGLVELHDGTVEARSDGAGRGSEFIVRLPAARESTTAGDAQSDEQRESSLAPLRILVVDDNHDSADTLANLLALMGNQVQAAYEGAEALLRAADMRPDVILLDIGMPKMNGCDVCASIREKEWGRDVFIFALTGWGQEEDRRRTADAGFDAHLVKPADPAELLKLLEAARTRGRVRSIDRRALRDPSNAEFGGSALAD